MNKVLIVIMFILLGSSLIVVSNMGKDVQNSFIIEYQNNKNLAYPDITGKEYLGSGVYRLLSISSGGTVDYNVYNGVYTFNGYFPQYYIILKFINNDFANNDINLSFKYLDGGLSYNIEVRSSNPYIYWRVMNSVDFSIYKNITSNNVEFVTTNNTTFDNYQFKLQIEKGTTATAYVVPKLIPVYKDNLSQQEKNEIGIGAFGGITKIIKTISDIIKPVGDFINGLLNMF